MPDFRSASGVLAGMCAGALACVIAACSPATDAPAIASPVAAADAAPAPVAAASMAASEISDADVVKFLGTVYGPSANLTDEWSARPVDAALKDSTGETRNAINRSVCAHESITHAGQPAVLVAVCGVRKQAGHPTTGLNDFFLLQGPEGALAATARAHMEEFGSNGAPGSVEVKRFGADLYGFSVESGFYNMGYAADTRAIVLPQGAEFVEAAWFRSGLGNEGHMKGCLALNDCGADEAFDIRFDMQLDDSNPAAAAYPLVIKESGEACGQRADAVHRLVLDLSTMRYTVPRALQRESCTVENP